MGIKKEKAIRGLNYNPSDWFGGAAAMKRRIIALTGAAEASSYHSLSVTRGPADAKRYAQHLNHAERRPFPHERPYTPTESLGNWW